MSRFIGLLIIPFFISGCYLTNGFKCGFNFLPEEAGSYTTQKIPQQYVALGDTLYLNINDYWEYEYECEDYGNHPDIESFIADSREVELHRQGNNVFIVGKKTGLFSATVIGSVYLKRNRVSNSYPVPMTFNVEVGTTSENTNRPRASFPSTGRIDSIVVSEVRKESKALRLIAELSPEEVSAYDSRWAFYPATGVDSLKQMEIPLKTIHSGSGNDIFFNPDSLYPYYYGYVQVRAGSRTFGKTFNLDIKPYFE